MNLHHRDTESPSPEEKNEKGYEHDPLTQQINGAAIEVHKFLGPGLIESVYEDCLCRELDLRGLKFKRQCEVDLIYKGLKLACQLKIDLAVEDSVLLELKVVDKLLPIHQAQLMTYLRLAQKKTGLLINFNCPMLIDGVKRISL